MLEWKIKDPFERTLAEQKEKAFTAGPGAKKTISISPSTRLADGRYIMRLFLKDKGGKVFDSCAVPFSVESPVRVKGVTIKQRRCAMGAKVEGAVHLI